MAILKKIIHLIGTLFKSGRRKNNGQDAIPPNSNSTDKNQQVSAAEEILKNQAYWEAYKRENHQEHPLKYRSKKTDPTGAPHRFPQPSKQEYWAWHIANKAYHKTTAWKLLRGKVLDRAEHKCEICHIQTADSVHWKIFPPVMESLIFKEPKMSELEALCGKCARERNKPSDWSDPRHPWYPDGDWAD